MAEPIKISELTETSAQGYVIETITEGGQLVSKKYNLANIVGQLKGYQIAGYLTASQYVGAYTNPFTTYIPSDKFIYLIEGKGNVGLLDHNGGQYTFTQGIGETKIILWNGGYIEKTIAQVLGEGMEAYPNGSVPLLTYQGQASTLSRYDLSRLPIFVRTWEEFVEVIESGDTEIDIYVREPIESPEPAVLDDTTYTELSISPATNKIVVRGERIFNLWRPLITSLERENVLDLHFENNISILSTFDYIQGTGYKGRLTYNVDKVCNVSFFDCQSAFLEIDNNQSTFVNIYGIARSTYNNAWAIALDSSIRILKEYANTNLIIENATAQITKESIGLGNVDNTSDADKPISTATQTALNAKVDKTTTINSKPLSSNVTLDKSDVGLGNVDNTSDLNKPISTATQTALNAKADDTNVLHKTGAETAGGVKTFSDGIKIASVGVQYDTTNECIKFVFN